MARSPSNRGKPRIVRVPRTAARNNFAALSKFCRATRALEKQAERRATGGRLARVLVRDESRTNPGTLEPGRPGKIVNRQHRSARARERSESSIVNPPDRLGANEHVARQRRPRVFGRGAAVARVAADFGRDRKSTRLNS